MLWLRGVLFTMLVPCVVGWYIPHLYVEGRGLKGGFWQIGWIAVVIGAAVYVVCLFDFLLAGGTPMIFFARPLRFALGEEPAKLVRNGLYRVTRNPMYAGVVMAVFGQAILYGSGGIAQYGVFLWLMFHLVVIVLEEPHLRAERGEAYKEYCRQVPRWLFRWR